MLFRIEVDAKTGERIEISQVAYRDVSGKEVIVLDASDPAPEGFFEFAPGEEDEVITV